MKDRRWSLLLLPLLLTAACHRQGDRPGAAVSDGAGLASGPKAFAPPEDGKLTAEQLEMYIAVRTKALEAAPAPAGKAGEIDGARLAAVVTADLAAARALGHDRAEYEWVKGRVLEARPRAASAVPPQLARAAAAMSLEGLKGLRSGSEDPDEVARLDRQVARIEAAQDEPGSQSETAKSEARVFNEELLARYEEQLLSLDAAALESMAAPPQP